MEDFERVMSTVNSIDEDKIKIGDYNSGNSLASNCNFILSSFPNTEEKQKELLSIISSIKNLGWDVTLISHFDCPKIIKNKVDLYIYNDNNTPAFKDSDVLGLDTISIIENIPFFKWLDLGGTSYYDYKGWIDFTPAIVSLLIPALGSSFSKGYEFCVYMETDFIFPEDFGEKMNSYFSELISNDSDSIFFSVPESHWVHSHLFILRMNDRVRSLIPKLNVKKNSDFISMYPNMVFEDFITKISDENRENSIFKTREDLNLFFGGAIGDKWDYAKLIHNKNEYTLYTTSFCSPYVNHENERDVRIVLNLDYNSPFSSVNIKFSLSDNHELLMEKSKILNRGEWVWHKMPVESSKLKFSFTVESMDGDGISSSDEYFIDTSKLSDLSKIRHFVER